MSVTAANNAFCLGSASGGSMRVALAPACDPPSSKPAGRSMWRTSRNLAERIQKAPPVGPFYAVRLIVSDWPSATRVCCDLAPNLIPFSHPAPPFLPTATRLVFVGGGESLALPPDGLNTSAWPGPIRRASAESLLLFHQLDTCAFLPVVSSSRRPARNGGEAKPNPVDCSLQHPTCRLT